jgi:hypothetical protein
MHLSPVPPARMTKPTFSNPVNSAAEWRCVADAARRDAKESEGGCERNAVTKDEEMIQKDR